MFVKWRIGYLAVLVAGGLATQAQAHLIDEGLITLDDPLGSPSDEASFIQTHEGLSTTPTYLGKNDSGYFDEGEVSSSHFTATTPSGTSSDLTWDLTGTGFVLNWVLVKDGAEAGTQGDQLYRLYSVSSDETLTSGSPQTITIDGDKGISHFSFFGSEGEGPGPGGTGVPDGGTTAMLMGASLAGISVLRKYLRK